MPVHNNTEASQRLREWMGAKGPAGIDTVSPEIVPVINVADLSSGVIGARRTRLCGGHTVQTAVAAQYSHCQLFNPATSTFDLIVLGMWPTPSTSGYCWLRPYNTALTTQSGNSAILDEVGSATFPYGTTGMAGQLRHQTSAGVLGTIILAHQYFLATGTVVFTDYKIRLTPGTGIQWIVGIVNDVLRVNWLWREIQRVP